MLRAMGVAAVLLSVACAQTNRLADEGPPSVERPDRGVADRGVVDDVGPVDQGEPPGPILDPLELQRTIATGRRLATRFWRLPDGLEVERLDRRLRDRELETLCAEIPGRTTESGDIRCVPFENVFRPDRMASATYADDACRQLTVPLRPAACPARFVTLSATSTLTGLDEPPRVYRDTSEESTTFFSALRGTCEAETRDFDSPRGIVEPFAESEMVPAEDSVTVFGAVAERTVRWADGTVVVRREPAEPCTFLRSRTTGELLPICVPGFLGASVQGRVSYEDPECAGEPVLQLAITAWDELDSRSGREQVILGTRDERQYVVRAVRSGPVAIEDPLAILYERTPDGTCVGRMRAHGHFVRLGEPVPITSFPTLTRAELGRGRLRALRWVDGEGVAWPFGRLGALDDFFPIFRDVELDEECVARFASDGVRRCMPLFAAAIATGRSPVDPHAPEFADAACTELVLRDTEDELPRYVRLWSPADDVSCRIVSLRDFSPSFVQPAGTYEVEGRVDLDGAFALIADGRCVPVSGGRFATLELVPPSTFAEIELLESP